MLKWFDGSNDANSEYRSEIESIRNEIEVVLQGEKPPRNWRYISVSEEHTQLFAVNSGNAYVKLADARREATSKLHYEHDGLIAHLQLLNRTSDVRAIDMVNFRGRSGLLTPNLGRDAEEVIGESHSRRGTRSASPLSVEQFAQLVGAVMEGPKHGDLGSHNLLIRDGTKKSTTGLPACFIDFTPMHRYATPIHEGLAEIASELGIAYQDLPKYLKENFSASAWQRLGNNR